MVNEHANMAFDDEFDEKLKPGQTLMQGQFTIEKFLNAGGFGNTYIARDSLDRKMVIKECFPEALCRRTNTSVQARSRSVMVDFGSVVQKFVAEAHSLAKLEHPNIVGVHQVFEENNTAYMVLDFIEGTDFLDVIEGEDKQPSPAEIEVILRKLLDAIAAIHAKDMLHRDISPDNILLKSDNEPVLIDFGAAREEAAQEDRARSKLRVIKDGYSPQEFYVAGAEQGPSSDLYALGATFYHAITKEVPPNAQARLAEIATGQPDPYVPVTGRVDGYSENFLNGIDRALKILAKDRMGSAAEWLDLLNGAEAAKPLHSGSREVSVVVRSPIPKTVSKSRARVLAGIGLMVPIVGSVLFVQTGGLEGPSDVETASLVSSDASISFAQTTLDTSADASATDAAPQPSELSAALNLPAAGLQSSDVATAQDEAVAAVPASALIAALNLPEEVETPSGEAAGSPLGAAPTPATPTLPIQAATNVSSLTDAVEDVAVLSTGTAANVYKTSLPDGTAFETRLTDGVWTTVVTEAPTLSNLEVDDVLVGELNRAWRFDQKTSLEDLLAEASAEGIDRLLLAVRREDVTTGISILISR